MAIKNMFYNSTDNLGLTNELVCPVCSSKGEMALFKNYDLVNVIAIIKQIDTQLNLAVCPHCASVFSVNENYVTAKQAGQTVFATPQDLALLVDGRKKGSGNE